MGRALTPGLMAGAVAEVSPTQLAQEEGVPGWHYQTTVLCALGIVLLLVIAGLLCWWRPPRRRRRAALSSEQQVGSPSCPRSASSLLLWLFLAFGMPGRGEGWRSFPDLLGQDGEAFAATIWKTREAPPSTFDHTWHAKEIVAKQMKRGRVIAVRHTWQGGSREEQTLPSPPFLGSSPATPAPQAQAPHLPLELAWGGLPPEKLPSLGGTRPGRPLGGGSKRSEGHSGPGGWSEFQGGRTGNFKNSRCAFLLFPAPPAPPPAQIHQS